MSSHKEVCEPYFRNTGLSGLVDEVEELGVINLVEGFRHSIATNRVLPVDFFLLKPLKIAVVMSQRAVTVECLDQKICWWVEKWRCSVMMGCMHFSRFFEAGQSKETGLYELLMPASLA